jgi:hypothetical protein
MSIFYICGKPGGGKSYLGVRQIVEELGIATSDRYIVTNIELMFGDRETVEESTLPWAWRHFGWVLRRLGRVPPETTRKKTLKGLATYCHEHFKHEVNLRERIRILDDSESGEFWLYEPGRKFEKRKQIKVGRHERDVPDFEDRAERGCLYVIDECHNYFPAREWQLTGNDATFFLSQHRKLNCDVILITQHSEQCDKALRRLAQEYMTVRNLSREPFLGFNLASWFGEFRFLRMLNSPQSGNPCVFESGFVSLNTEEIGALYDTMQGVGIAGRVVAKREQRGRSLWWLLVPISIVVVAACLVFSHIREINHAVASGLGRMLFHASTNVVAAVHLPQVVSQTAGVVPLPPTTGFVPGPVSRDAFRLNARVPTNDVYCVGYCIIGGPVAFLSDGSRVTPDEGLQKIERNRVTISGRVYPVRQFRDGDFRMGYAGSGSSPALFAPPASPAFVSETAPIPSSWTPLHPVNQADILPAIHGQGGGSPPALNGFSRMGGQFSQGRQNYGGE